MMLVVGLCAVAVVGFTTDDGIITGKMLYLYNDQGEIVVSIGTTDSGDGVLDTYSKSGQRLIYAGAAADGTGFLFQGYNKTGEPVITLGVDDYGNGEVGAWNRKGEGRKLTSQ